MTGATSAIRDDGRRALHDGLPGGIGHRRDEHIALFEFCEMVRIAENVCAPVPYLLADAWPVTNVQSVACPLYSL